MNMYIKGLVFYEQPIKPPKVIEKSKETCQQGFLSVHLENMTDKRTFILRSN